MNARISSVRRIGALSIVALAFGSHSPAIAASAAPIDIRSCSAVYAADENTPFGIGYQRQSGIAIDFINRGAVAADEVTFRLAGNSAVTLVDRGTFTPGVTIRAIFETTSSAPDTCRVAQTHFADGTIYDAGARVVAAKP